jgi:hypothetical protein
MKNHTLPSDEGTTWWQGICAGRSVSGWVTWNETREKKKKVGKRGKIKIKDDILADPL